MLTCIQIRVPEGELGALDDYRREQRNPPSRARAVMDIVRRALRETKAQPAQTAA
jgi:hypothetical protein